MKKTKGLLVALVVFGLIGFTIGSAGAAAWYSCTVEVTGQGGARTLLRLTDTDAAPAFTGQWFIADPTVEKEMLAVALTAIVNNKIVRAYIDSPTPYSVVRNLYLKAN